MIEMFLASHLHWATFAAKSLVAAAWEGALLVGCVALCLKILPGVSAAARSILWVAVLMLLATLPFLHKVIPGGEGVGGRLEVNVTWAWVLAAVWLTFAVARFAQLLRSGWHLHKVSANAEELSSEKVKSLQLDGIEMPRFRNVSICTSGQVGVPCVAGFYKPRVLIPPVLLDTISAVDLRQIVQHELEHLRRYDDWINLAQKCSLALFPLNPGLWWVERRLCLERELACDDSVLLRTGAPKAYAVCLANLAEKSLVRRNVSLVLGAWRHRSELAKRIYRILQSPKHQWGSGLTVAVLSSLLVLAGVGTVSLGRNVSLVSFSKGSIVASVHPTLTASVAMPPNASLQNASAMSARAVPVNAIVYGRRKHRARVVPKRIVSPPVVVASVAHPRIEPSLSTEKLVVWRARTAKHPKQRSLISEDSHFTYAAIPLPDGWLIVQL